MIPGDAPDPDSTQPTQLVQAFQGLVRWQISRLISDAHVVDDLAQEVFFAWFETSRSQTRHQVPVAIESVKGWLLTVARNKAVDWLRKNAREKVGSNQMREFPENEDYRIPVDSDVSFESERQTERRLESLRHCLGLLQPEHREMVHEFYTHGKSSELIGVQLGKGSSNVRMMLTRIRRALAKCIQRQLERSP